MKTVRSHARFGFIAVMVYCTQIITADEGSIIDDPYEIMATEALRQATTVLHLQQTELKDLVAEYYVETPANLSWEQVLAYANQKFAADKIQRALFLRKFYVKGQSSADLKELNLKTFGFSTGTGGGQSISFILIELPHRENDSFLHFPQPLVSIDTWISYGEWITDSKTGKKERDENKAVLLSIPTLMIRKVKVKDMLFDHLTFDASDKLVSFATHRDISGNLTLTVGGNNSGKNGSNFYSANVMNAHENRLESRSYSPNQIITERSVYKSGPWKQDYTDKYRDGLPFNRYYYQYNNGVGKIVKEMSISKKPLPPNPK